tara:strand:- start:112 stop:471 length:360 start_codon:yes stop_codon:yes gene_type:complete
MVIDDEPSGSVSCLGASICDWQKGHIAALTLIISLQIVHAIRSSIWFWYMFVLGSPAIANSANIPNKNPNTNQAPASLPFWDATNELNPADARELNTRIEIITSITGTPSFYIFSYHMP